MIHSLILSLVLASTAAAARTTVVVRKPCGTLVVVVVNVQRPQPRKVYRQPPPQVTRRAPVRPQPVTVENSYYKPSRWTPPPESR